MNQDLYQAWHSNFEKANASKRTDDIQHAAVTGAAAAVMVSRIVGGTAGFFLGRRWAQSRRTRREIEQYVSADLDAAIRSWGEDPGDLSRSVRNAIIRDATTNIYRELNNRFPMTARGAVASVRERVGRR